MNQPSFTRCRYVSDDGLECEKWFQPTPEMNSGKDPRFCELHRGIVSPSTITTTDNTKSQYIEVRNQEVALVVDMTLEQIDAHIAGLEKQLELLKTRVISSRAVRADKIEKLTDEERAARKKIHVERPATNDKPKAAKPASIKKDPVAALMAKGMSEKMARQLLDME